MSAWCRSFQLHSWSGVLLFFKSFSYLSQYSFGQGFGFSETCLFRFLNSIRGWYLCNFQKFFVCNWRVHACVMERCNWSGIWGLLPNKIGAHAYFLITCGMPSPSFPQVLELWTQMALPRHIPLVHVFHSWMKNIIWHKAPFLSTR